MYKALYYTAPRNPVVEGHRVETFDELALAMFRINREVTFKEILDQWGRIQK